MVSIAMTPAPSSAERTPLSPAEKTRLRELIPIVNRGLASFLEVGRALAAIKAERLYRETHGGDFDAFCRDTFGLPRSHCETLVRSTHTAELLIANGAEISPQIAESTLRRVTEVANRMVAKWAGPLAGGGRLID